MALNVNKTLGKNKISVKIIKISDEVMTKPSLLSVEIAKLWQMYKLNNDSWLPNTLDLYKLASLSSKFTSDDICKIIMALNVNKTPGNDKISVRIIKISD